MDTPRFEQTSQDFGKVGRNKIEGGFEEYQLKRQEVTGNFIQELERQKEKFKYIFETEKGSKYFVLNTGEVIRFRFGSSINGVGFHPEPISGKVFFVDQTQCDELLPITKSLYGQEIFDKEIKKAPLADGVHPIEMNSEIAGPTEIEFDEDDDTIIIRACRDTKTKVLDKKNLSGGFHIGHKVVKIIKS